MTAPGRLGAWPTGAGMVEFRLWAPDINQVELVLCGAALPMLRQADGVHWIRTTAAQGDRYRFRLPDGSEVPDPASRWQPEGVESPSAVLAEDAYAWQTRDWGGVAWPDMVIYEVHVEAAGGFAALTAQLPMLAATGITAIELMPVAQFPGSRNWGYDGVFPYAPAQAYGGPEALKRFVDAAHAAGLAVLLDVVYNHFGPQGNHLAQYAKGFFHSGRSTPWGEAIDFEQPWVQRFFIDNALMWLQEYRFDGLRLDAVHAIDDDRFLQQLSDTIRAEVPHAHLVLENERNQARWLRGAYQAQWNDDFHNALHVLLTGEHEGYYAAYAGRAEALLARCLAEGFAWQGEPDLQGEARGEPSGDLPPSRFVVFAQNHDQVGNRAFGDRLSQLLEPQALRMATALTVLTPMVPMLFMGEPWQATAPFLFFTDYQAPLDEAVREGRRREFAGFSAFADAASRARIPDPNDPETLQASYVPPPGDGFASQQALAWLRDLLSLRRRCLQPGLEQARSLGAKVLGPGAVQAGWQLPAGQWWIAINAGPAELAHSLPDGERLLDLPNGPLLPPGGGLQLRWLPA
ncbi:malto-oligosyltrehalose trehalohydrolase [Stenotrophomonas sp. ZAC14D1_NAIMI4_6]|uniref:malto-oligosyltrehalose trehalohydrolase n=1 Tax=Stenotrophomonas TaxID=40323 RepID=UPI000D53D2EF|nr:MULTISPECIES: malto-oligosyltrehalose trehalohydrolase [Stenotrophomonas]AWH37367.1 malto-oligosyltrehalose trehalohydrolase [Stenotrophomonas sp. ZAC14D1_NAIMI4_6]AWH41556.1 malto-oligosyltrehalose trehalohydrolase [Stenotrophomonas sp. ZAC14D1_NAIMI4_1]